jgi:ketosteroid isomerase-like protein
MSETNADLVRRGLEAMNTVNEGGMETLRELLDPEFEVTTPPSLASEPDTYRGAEGVKRYFDSFYEAMDRIHFEAGEIRDFGDRVAVEFTLRARGRTTGIEAEQHAALVWTLRDGRALRLEVFPTLDEALAAVED